MNQDTLALRSKLQLFFIQKIKAVDFSNEKDLGDESSIQCLLKLLHFLLNMEQNSEENDLYIINDFKSKFLTAYSKDSVSKEFKENFYNIFLTQILVNLSRVNDEIKELLLRIIFVTNFTDTFNVLYDLCTNNSLTHENKNPTLKKFHIYLLKQFLTKHQLKNLLIEQTRRSQQHMCLTSSSLPLIQRLTNLPDKLCNYSSSNKVFNSISYFKIVTIDLWLCLKHFYPIASINLSSDDNNEFSLEFISTLFGKISFLGFSGL